MNCKYCHREITKPFESPHKDICKQCWPCRETMENIVNRYGTAYKTGMKREMALLGRECPKFFSDCCVSTGICGTLTSGRGELDENGYFEIPCSECLKMMHSKSQKYDVFLKQAKESLITEKAATFSISIGELKES